MLRTFRCPYRLENGLENISPWGQSNEETDGFFFVSDKADGYFMSSPLEWGCEVLLGKMFEKKGLEIIKICAEFW